MPSRLSLAYVSALPEDHWIQDRMPDWLLGSGPLGLVWWQWVAFFVLIPLSLLVGALLGRLTHYVLGRVTKKTTVTWDDALVEALAPPLRWVWSLVVFRALVEALALDAADERTASSVVRTLIFLCLFWAVFRLLDNVQRGAATSEWGKRKPIARSLVPIAMRVTKVVVLIIAVISLLSHLGYPVAGLIAGLGIGGIAIALAGQKTVENLFGAFSIGIDQPFREGDLIQVDGQMGTVESIGLRSTRVRTPDRTVVTIPNAQMAEARVESFAERDRIRFKIALGITYETTGAQLKQILAGITAILTAHPRVRQVEKDDIVVRFVGFGPSSLDLEVVAWFETTDFNEFRALREEVLMAFIGVVEKAGSSFAFPTHTVHVKESPARAPS